MEPLKRDYSPPEYIPDLGKRPEKIYFAPDIKRLRPKWWAKMHSEERRSSVHKPQ